MRIRGEEVLLPCSMIGGYPRPHWLQGRVFGSMHEPLYRGMDLRIAYEDAVRLAAQDQEWAGLDILADAQQYMPWEAPAFQIEPIFHYNTEMLGGLSPLGTSQFNQEVRKILYVRVRREDPLGPTYIRGCFVSYERSNQQALQDRLLRARTK